MQNILCLQYTKITKQITKNYAKNIYVVQQFYWIFYLKLPYI